MTRLLAALALAAVPAGAGPLSPDDAPAALKPWVRWVMRGYESSACPLLNASPAERVCAWPGPLRLELTEKGGRFSQSWRVYAEGWVRLPGGSQHWPLDVTLDGRPAAVTAHEDAAAVYLKPGAHSLAGSFKWDALPDVLDVSPDTGLLTLSLDGKPLRLPQRDEAGRLWLQRARPAAGERPHLEVSVRRRLEDGVPLLLFTQVELRVSGPAREELLGRALPPGFVPMALSSPLPARVERDGRLRVQARAGTYVLELEARHEGPAAEVALADPGGPWDSSEAWAFEAHEELRSVSVQGAQAVDPQQTELPPAWCRFPAYIMRPGSVLRLVERRRGDADPEPDKLSLSRTWWLDFDGRGLTVQDRLTGTLSRSWRLTMGPGAALGRVSVGGQDQFLTALSSGGPAGVELREGQLDAEADSRVEPRGFATPAVGWQEDFERVEGRLNLPPGWRLVHAWGVDRAEPSWVTDWTLLDLFLVTILALAVGRLWDRRWGWAALAAAGLTWHEPGALRWCWLWALAGTAVARALPEGALRRAAQGVRWTALGLGLVFALPFVINQVRWGMFPQLEPVGEEAPFLGLLPTFSMGAAANVEAVPPQPFAAPAAAPEEADELEAGKEMAERRYEAKAAARGMGMMAAGSALFSAPRPSREVSAPLLQLDPSQAVATGPGVPTWQWRAVTLTWRGPVRAGQRLRLWLYGPRVNLLLSLARAALTAALLLLLMGLPVEAWLSALRRPGGPARALRWLFPVLLLAALVPRASAQDGFPPQAMLDDLRARLTASPDCAPSCADSPRLRLEATPTTLRGRLEVDAGAPVAVPLPGGARSWTPASVLVDGAPAAGLRRAPDGSLWLPLAAGAHQVLFEGPLPDAETVQLPLPLKPRRVEASASGWSVHGLREDGRPEDSLELARSRGATGPSAALQPGALPPFVRVERVLRLGLTWRAETRVVRLTPAGTAVTLAVPLLPRESVTSDVQVKDGKALVTLPPQAGEARWSSVLEPAATLVLKAPAAASWVEDWTLEAGPVWHVEAAGLAPVQQEPGGARARRWRPWPGESVTLSVTRPAGAPARTLTLDSAALALSPGLRATDASLTVVWRSSRGGQHALDLPAGAELRSVRVNGDVLPLRLEGSRLTVPVQPGEQTVEVSWREPRGISPFFRTSAVGLGAPAVNEELRVTLPADRWVLFVGGPRLGPVVLFWSALAVFLLVGAGLARTGLAPLGWRAWLLLSVGLTQVPAAAAALVAGWLLLLGWRGRGARERAREFDALQLFIGLVTALALGVLFAAIQRGLLGRPDMQVGGHGSTAALLDWYQDRSGEALPRAWALSLPLGVYRLAMLAWALWLADALLGWLKWGWSCFSAGGLWKPWRVKAAPPEPPRPAAA